jgi:formylmethanofuran dehydrogenase subunit C
MSLRLVLRQAPTLRVDARRLQPQALAAVSGDDLRHMTLPHGRDEVELGEWFDVVEDGAGSLVLQLEGDLARFDAIGAGLVDGTLVVRGDVGDAAGLGMAGGRLVVEGSARDLTGCAMRGGVIEIKGGVRDLAASALPGEMDGMSGGTLIVRGAAGARLADRMRRGTVAVFGDVGEFAAARLVAGTVAFGGRSGAHAGWGMRRGSLVFAGAPPELGPTFVPVDADAGVFWQLLARDLARLGPPFDGLAVRPVGRFAGDLAVQGRGEVLVPG